LLTKTTRYNHVADPGFRVRFIRIIGLATDSGNVLVNKTRLQNALDATALSAASTVNADPKKDTARQQQPG